MGMDVYGRDPSSKEGEYFRANVWSWRPIHMLCETVMKKRLDNWGYNDGHGLNNQKECTELADKLEAYLRKFPQEKFTIESSMRVDSTGRLLPGPTEGESAYNASREHVEEFITFLRHCGGFEIC